MRSYLLLPIIGCLLLTLITLSGCRSSEESTAVATTRTFNHESLMYRVEVEQHERDDRCIRRDVRFTAFNRLYTEPYVGRVRAVDIGCDATYVTDFEEFDILRSPDQQARYDNSYAFRSRVNQDLWDTYLAALFNARQV